MKTEQFFRCLADSVRVKIVLLLCHQGELNATSIASVLNSNESTIKRHMALMVKNQIVLFRQKDLYHYYRINPDLPVWMQKILKHTYRGNKKIVEALPVVKQDVSLNAEGEMDLTS